MSLNPRENLLKLFRRQGIESAPVQFSLCPSLESEFRQRFGGHLKYEEFFEFPWRNADEQEILNPSDEESWRRYYKQDLKEGTRFDHWGVAHEPGSAAAMHMTQMYNPMKSFTSMDQFREYPYPEYSDAAGDRIREQVRSIQAGGLAAAGNMACTIWETGWYMRGMEELMMEMMTDDPLAEYHLDRITDIACRRASAFASAGVDILNLGDDVGMQQSLMMSGDLYRTWLKPRLKRVIDTAKKINPQIIVTYHSCGFVTPLIPDLMEAGIDVLNPVQPECMDFRELHDLYGDRLSFWGSVGTQTTMPFGTPEDVRKTVLRNLDIAGSKGGLLCAPTHLVEPEVPWDNIMAYVQACRDFSGSLGGHRE